MDWRCKDIVPEEKWRVCVTKTILLWKNWHLYVKQGHILWCISESYIHPFACNHYGPYQNLINTSRVAVSNHHNTSLVERGIECMVIPLCVTVADQKGTDQVGPSFLSLTHATQACCHIFEAGIRCRCLKYSSHPIALEKIQLSRQLPARKFSQFSNPGPSQKP